jgi:hypothetical protein
MAFRLRYGILFKHEVQRLRSRTASSRRGPRLRVRAARDARALRVQAARE